jgi:glycosyltransferase involved in cell wall biosynthesis
MKHVLYLTRNGLLEPLGQSQILPYLKGLSGAYQITLITFEKPADRVVPRVMCHNRYVCDAYGLLWIPLRFRPTPRPWAPALAIPQLGLVALCQWRHHQKPALIHARSYVPAAIALVLHWLSGVPFIFDMRALWPEELITAGHLRRGSLLHRTLLWLERRCLKEASGVVSLTHAAVTHLTAQYPREMETQRVVVIPTCADLQRFQHAPLSPLVEPRVIGCIGTLLSGWFLNDWLRAFFEAVARVDTTARFEIISRDSRESILKALNPDPVWRDRLLIEAAQPDQMPAIVQRHTASVMFYSGGATSELGRSPTRLAEVLGCGRPVIANLGVGDVGDVIRQHRVGVLALGARPDQMDSCVVELLDLLNGPELTHRCRRTAEKLFSLEAGTAAYRQLYADILA